MVNSPKLGATLQRIWALQGTVKESSAILKIHAKTPEVAATIFGTDQGVVIKKTSFLPAELTPMESMGLVYLPTNLP